MKPWSYSSLTAFETCPRRYDLVRNQKAIVEPPTDATEWGVWVHKQFEDAARDGTPLPDKISKWQGVVDKLVAKPGEKLIEQQLAVSASFEPAEWWTSWARGVIDFGVVNGDKAGVFDYKTGKRKPDSDQLKLFAGFTFTNYPQVNTVVTGFLWLQDNKLDKEVFTRDQLGVIWQSFLPRVARLEAAFEKGKWPAKPSGLCRNWCPVPRSMCEFSGRTK